MLMSRCFLLLVASAGVAASAAAQNLTLRSSDARFNAVYGGGGDTFTPNGTAGSSALESASSIALAFADSRSGFILDDPNRPWGASVSSASGHSFAVTGPLDSFSKIVASGSTGVTASSSGEGLANIISSEDLELRFSLTSTKLMRLRGAVNLNPDGQNLAGQVALQKFDGIVWGQVFNSWFLPGQEGSFDNTYNLTAGDYRILGNSSGNAFHRVRPSQDNDWNYELEVVPEPLTLLALGVGALGLMRRRNRR